MTERWIPVPRFVGRYEISDLGRVRSVARYIQTGFGFRWQPSKIVGERGHRGYAYVMLWKNGKRKNLRVNRLVLTAFVGPRPSHVEAMHTLPDRLDNRLTNLEWGTAEQNREERHVRDVGPPGYSMAEATEFLREIEKAERLKGIGNV